jgi:nitrous oxide reductase
LTNTTTVILGISIITISIAIVLFAISIPILTSQHVTNLNIMQQNNTLKQYTGVKKEFYLFDTEIPGFNETEMGMPHDIFSMPVIAVYKNDKVVIHFYNIEEPGGDNHSFTIYDKPYNNIDVIVRPGETKNITFIANTTGTFTYLCTFHQPTMRGTLIVQPPPQT